MSNYLSLYRSAGFLGSLQSGGLGNWAGAWENRGRRSMGDGGRAGSGSSKRVGSREKCKNKNPNCHLISFRVFRDF